MSERWKYIRYKDINPVQEELFDLSVDPQETNNLINNPEYEEEIQGLKAKMKKIGLEQGDPRFTGDMALFNHTHQYCNQGKESRFDGNWKKNFKRSYDEGLKAVGLPSEPKN